MEEVAQPPLPAELHRLATLRGVVGAVSASAARSDSFHLPDRSETMIRRAGCGNPASPDLWGTWVGNHPGLPDRGSRMG